VGLTTFISRIRDANPLRDSKARVAKPPAKIIDIPKHSICIFTHNMSKFATDIHDFSALIATPFFRFLVIPRTYLKKKEVKKVGVIDNPSGNHMNKPSKLRSSVLSL
jgi:hypothetical protein